MPFYRHKVGTHSYCTWGGERKLILADSSPRFTETGSCFHLNVILQIKHFHVNFFSSMTRHDISSKFGECDSLPFSRCMDQIPGLILTWVLVFSLEFIVQSRLVGRSVRRPRSTGHASSDSFSCAMFLLDRKSLILRGKSINCHNTLARLSHLTSAWRIRSP